MRSFVFYVISLLGSVVIAPAVCPAEDSNRFSFPLPLSLAVGDRWIYSIVKTHLKYEDDLKFVGRILDTLSTETLTIRVVESLQIEDRTYFALSDGGLYRVDEEKRTWRYDTEAKSEKIVWDIWGPLEDKIIELPLYRLRQLEPVIERPVIDGYACEYGCFSRHGPFVWSPVPEYEGHYAWISTIEVDTFRHDSYLGYFIYPPFVWSYDDFIKFPDWGITELYVFRDTPYSSEYVPEETLVVAPNVGVVYYASSSYIYNLTISPSETKKTEWVLQDMQKGHPESTVVEDISFGALKQRMTRSTSKAP